MPGKSAATSAWLWLLASGMNPPSGLIQAAECDLLKILSGMFSIDL
jgi:hypothetical protein